MSRRRTREARLAESSTPIRLSAFATTCERGYLGESPVDNPPQRYNFCKNFLRAFSLDAIDSFRVFCADASPAIIPQTKKPAAVAGAGFVLHAMMSLCW